MLIFSELHPLQLYLLFLQRLQPQALSAPAILVGLSELPVTFAANCQLPAVYLEASVPLCQPFVVYLEEFCDLPVGFGAVVVVFLVDLSAGIGSPHHFSSIQ